MLVASKHEHNRKHIQIGCNTFHFLLDTASVGKAAALASSHRTGYIHTYVRTYVHIRMYTYVRSIHMHTYVYVRSICTYVYVRTYIHTLFGELG